MELKGAVALVTGAGHRVGRAIALALAGAGADVVVHYGGSRAAAEATAAEIAGLGVAAEAWPADLADPAAIAGLFERVTDRFGRLDVLVNSAATFRKQSFGRVSAADWDAALAVNLRAPFLCTQHAAPLMRAAARPGGAPRLVVNLADLSGVYPWKGYVQHGVSKAGLLHLTRIAARELAPDIRVNAVVPGAILPPPGVDPDGDLWQAMGGAAPLGRPGHPDRVGEAVVFLAANDYITGVALPVDGGEHLVGPINH